MRNSGTINWVLSNLVCSGYHKFCKMNFILVRIFSQYNFCPKRLVSRTALLPFLLLPCLEFEVFVDGPEEVRVHFA